MCKKKVVLGQYKGLKMKTRPITVSDSEIMQAVAGMLEQASVVNEIKDRPVAMGDNIILNFAGFTEDGVQFDGGTAEDYPLTIGSHSFIDGFEDQLVGAEIGAEVKVNVTFPEAYGASELAGKPAVFVCTVKAIEEKVEPEFTDAFCKENLGFDTIEEYKEHLKANLLKDKQDEMNQTRIQTLVARVVADCEADLDENEVEALVDQQLAGFAQNLQQQGLSLEQYLQMMGGDEEMIRAQIRPEAANHVKTQVVLHAIADAEGLTVDDADVEYRLTRFASQFGMDPAELMNAIGEAELVNLREELLLNKAASLILESVIDEAE